MPSSSEAFYKKYVNDKVTEYVLNGRAPDTTTAIKYKAQEEREMSSEISGKSRVICWV